MDPDSTPGTYDVVLLVEEALTDGDAARIRSLHAELDENVVYHLLLPSDDAAAAVEASLGTMTAASTPGDLTTFSTMPLGTTQLDDVDELQQRLRDEAAAQLAASVAALEAAGATVGQSAVVSGAPVDELAARITAVGGQEAIVLTRPHVVAEFFHVDWSNKARRRLGVPVLHMLEHESFHEQGYGE